MLSILNRTLSSLIALRLFEKHAISDGATGRFCYMKQNSVFWSFENLPANQYLIVEDDFFIFVVIYYERKSYLEFVVFFSAHLSNQVYAFTCVTPRFNLSTSNLTSSVWYYIAMGQIVDNKGRELNPTTTKTPKLFVSLVRFHQMPAGKSHFFPEESYIFSFCESRSGIFFNVEHFWALYSTLLRASIFFPKN